ncbi:MAG TPA: 2-hydroxyacid dehydrogenase [Nocardioidaceae bacterium]|nr:2-hydroxyacid dehydrogenase [Nocardioidaceae bacterium]
MSDTRPLVWMPFDASEVGSLPSSLRYEKFLPEEHDGVPESVAEVEFYVPPYRFQPSDNELMALMPRLKVVQTVTAGVDHVRPYLPEGVVLCNGRGIHDASTAELAVGLVIASLRGIPGFVRAQDREEWRPIKARSLADRTVLIVGYGAIGAAIEKRLAGFEVDLLRVARRPRDGVHGFDELDRLLPQADVVILIVPITDETRGLVDRDFLARMKDDALLVNVARGPIVDTDALVEALHTERIHAALDVTDPEPLPEGHPLWSAPNLLVSPHVGGGSSAMWPRAYKLVREQLERFARDEPLANVMNGDY